MQITIDDNSQIQIIYPMTENYKTNYTIGNAGANFWYQLKNEKFKLLYDFI